MVSQKGNISLALILIVLLAGGVFSGYFYGKNTSNKIPPLIPQSPPNLTPNPESIDKSKYDPLSECTQKECLFSNPGAGGAIEGFARLEGFFHTYEADDWGTKTTCNSLLVTGGNEKLINSFRYEIKSGNTLNKLDKNNNLMVNINIDNLDPTTKSRVQSSNLKNPVELGVIRVTPVGREASTCTNVVEIIYAKPLNK